MWKQARLENCHAMQAPPSSFFPLLSILFPVSKNGWDSQEGTLCGPLIIYPHPLHMDKNLLL